MKEIVFATHNPYKLEEIQKIIRGRIRILSLTDISCNEDIEETGKTLEENALIKARYIKGRFGYDCFADDTGLEVKALGGAPGVYSSRYAGDELNPLKNMNKLVSALQGIENRSAQFRTVIALILNGKEQLFEGVIKGAIIDEKRGQHGFGYDPIFVPDGYHETFAELGNDIKNSISHRAIATKKLVKSLLKQVP